MLQRKTSKVLYKDYLHLKWSSGLHFLRFPKGGLSVWHTFEKTECTRQRRSHVIPFHGFPANMRTSAYESMSRWRARSLCGCHGNIVAVFPERGAFTNEWDRVNCRVDFRVIKFCTSHRWLLLGVVKNDFMWSCLCATTRSVPSSLAFSFLYSFDTTWANPRPGRPSRFILLHFLPNDGRGGLFVCVFLLSSVLLNLNVILRSFRPSFVAMSELEVTVIMDRAQKIFRAGDRLWGKVLVIVRRQTNIRGKFCSEHSWKKEKSLHHSVMPLLCLPMLTLLVQFQFLSYQKCVGSDC